MLSCSLSLLSDAAHNFSDATSLGIAHVALETADVAMMGDDLTLARAARLSRKTLRIAKENIAFSLAI